MIKVRSPWAGLAYDGPVHFTFFFDTKIFRCTRFAGIFETEGLSKRGNTDIGRNIGLLLVRRRRRSRRKGRSKATGSCVFYKPPHRSFTMKKLIAVLVAGIFSVSSAGIALAASSKADETEKAMQQESGMSTGSPAVKNAPAADPVTPPAKGRAGQLQREEDIEKAGGYNPGSPPVKNAPAADPVKSGQPTRTDANRREAEMQKESRGQ